MDAIVSIVELELAQIIKRVSELGYTIALTPEAKKFLANKEDRQPWHNMIQMLPSSYNQMRTVTLNYENLINMYYARRNHKLAEWHTFCDWIESLPYSELITGVEK